MEVVDALLAAGLDMNACPSSALQIAMEKGNLRMAERLLRADADVNAPPGLFATISGGRNLNAIQLGASSGSLDVVEMLLLAGADVNAPAAEDGGLTALQAAALHGHLNVVRRLLSSHADVNAAPAKNNGYTVMQAAERSGSFDVIEVLLKPLGVIQVNVESAQGFTSSYTRIVTSQGFTSSYTRIVASGIEMARTKTAQYSSKLFQGGFLYVPLCHATREIRIEMVGQGNRGKYYCLLSHFTVVSDLVAETDGILMMRQPLRRTYYGNQKDSKLSCVISFYPCLTTQGVSKQPSDNETVQSNPDVQTPWDLTRLNSQEDPAISLDELIKCETGFIMFKFLGWTAPPGPSSVQIQVLLDDLPSPSYSYTVAQIGNSQLKRVGHSFIRDLFHSKITFRLLEGGGQFDETGRVLASKTQNTLDLLKHCLRNSTEMTLLDELERVAITFTLSMDYIPVEKNIERGQLRVDVLDTIIPKPHVDRDAYCEFYLNEQIVFKTHAVKTYLWPAWNESFEVEIPSRIDTRFRVWEYELDAILGTEKALGNAVIDLQLLEPCNPQEFKIQIARTSGSIRLQLLFRPEWTTRARRQFL